MFNSALNMMQLQSDKLSEVELCKMTLGYFQSWLGRVQEEFFLVLLKCIDWIFAVSRDDGACRIVAMLHLSHKGNHLTTYHQLFRPTQNNFMLHISHWLTSGNQSHNKDFGNKIMFGFLNQHFIQFLYCSSYTVHSVRKSSIHENWRLMLWSLH